MALLCPNCGYDKTKVKVTVGSTGENSLDRRRHCPNCDENFKTVESLVANQRPLEDIIHDAVMLALQTINSMGITPSNVPTPQTIRHTPSEGCTNH